MSNPDPAVLAHKIRDLIDEMYPDPAWEDHMRVCRERADAREQINTLTSELDMVSKKLIKALADNAVLRGQMASNMTPKEKMLFDALCLFVDGYSADRATWPDDMFDNLDNAHSALSNVTGLSRMDYGTHVNETRAWNIPSPTHTRAS